jgi:hypothetical protein
VCSYELLPQCKQRMAACLPFRVASVCCLAAGDFDSDIPMSQAGSRSLPAALAAAAATAAVIPPLPAGNKNGSSAHSARPAASVLSDHNHNLACLLPACLPQRLGARDLFRQMAHLPPEYPLGRGLLQGADCPAACCWSCCFTCRQSPPPVCSAQRPAASRCKSLPPAAAPC